MKWVRFIIVGFFILLLFAGALTCFLPNRVNVSRDLHIPARIDVVQRYLRDTTEWAHWIVWPVGDSPQVATLAHVSPGDILVDYQFKRMLPDTGGFSLDPDEFGGTRVQWTISFRFRWYPWEKLAGVAMDKVWGTPMDSSLGRLKAALATP